ncbi:calmodulin-like protein 3 [Patiria miniata]|uniref:EF-hand domain-containing protein n=1 Tax=Patiria miniata TaxID=46514 RepID=A0A914ARX6_PATMI|nr:calmodulin-like protein 3 [Patiria miniata]XP_038066204.1 calmodulin-like protein 3 [Patiria miniata]XP_038066206.1 calmodulin-like protein 3 [Patiria miniata]
MIRLFLLLLALSHAASALPYAEREDPEEFDDMDEGTLSSYRDTFIEYDADGSGGIDLTELFQYMMVELGQNRPQFELRGMIAEFDTNHSGSIDFTEFVRMMLGMKSSV